MGVCLIGGFRMGVCLIGGFGVGGCLIGGLKRWAGVFRSRFLLV